MPCAGEVLLVAAQVAPVRRQRVRRQPALDRQVVEVGADRPAPASAPTSVERRRHVRQARPPARRPRCRPPRRPGALVSCPAWVLRPSARLWSSRQACCPALVGQRHGVRHGRVGQGVGRGVRHRAGHVRHAVERSSCAPGTSGPRAWSAWVSSKQPPWSTAMSTSTEPGFICETSSLLTSLGAAAPGISTAPMTMSASHDLLLDRQLGRRQPVHPVVVAPERHPQLVQVGVEQGDVGTHAERDVGGVLARRRRRR